MRPVLRPRPLLVPAADRPARFPHTASALRLPLFLLSPLFVSPVHAFDHAWSDGWGDGWPQVAVGVACATDGTVVLTGDFQGEIDLGGGPLASDGEYDVFLAAFDASGAHRFSRRFGDLSNDKARGVALDEGAVVLTGDFLRTIDLGGGPLGSAGDKDVFLARYDLGGNHVWSRRYGDADYDGASAVAVGPDGTIYLAGQFRGSIDFGGGPLVAVNGEDVFLAAFDPAGSHVFSRRFGGPGNQRAHGLAALEGGDVVLVGAFAGVIDFGTGHYQSMGGDDAFVARFTRDGVTVGSHVFPGPGDQRAFRVAGFGGDIVVFGDFTGSVDLGFGPFASQDGADLFVTRLGVDGAPIWGRAIGGVWDQLAGGVALGANGTILLTGRAAGQVDFGGGSLVAAGWFDLFLARLDGEGAHVESVLFGDGADQWGEAIASSAADGSFALAGTFAGLLDLGAGPLANGGGFDVALARFVESVAAVPDGAPVPPSAPASGALLHEGALVASPNPFGAAVRITSGLTVSGPVDLSVFTADGRLVARLLDGVPLSSGGCVDWEAPGLAAGIYLARLRAGRTVQMARLVCIR